MVMRRHVKFTGDADGVVITNAPWLMMKGVAMERLDIQTCRVLKKALVDPENCSLKKKSITAGTGTGSHKRTWKILVIARKFVDISRRCKGPRFFGLRILMVG